MLLKMPIQNKYHVKPIMNILDLVLKINEKITNRTNAKKLNQKKLESKLKG
jgi:hypothetical protein